MFEVKTTVNRPAHGFKECHCFPILHTMETGIYKAICSILASSSPHLIYSFESFGVGSDHCMRSLG